MNAPVQPPAVRRSCVAIVASALVILPVALLLVACAVGPALSAGYDLDAGMGGDDDMPTGVRAAIEITYRRAGDSLEFASVTKYFGAEILSNQRRGTGHTTTTVRFDGGIPVWELRADKGFGSGITSMIGLTNHRIDRLRYGQLPSGFAQITPDSGPPEPLERGGFYIFEVDRESGSTSYQAVKVRLDGTLEGYNAQPRAGSSFELCCDVSPDFPAAVSSHRSADDSSLMGP